MSTVKFQFNSVELPHVRGYSEQCNSAVDRLNVIDIDGVKSDKGKMGARSIQISGQIQGADHDAVRAAWLTVLAAVYDDDGGNEKAYLRWHDSRRIECQVMNNTFDFTQRDAGLATGSYTILFSSDQPYWEQLIPVAHTDSGLSTGATFNYDNSSFRAPCWPVITVTATAQLNSDIVLTNSTTGAVWTFSANLAAGKVLVVDMFNRTVTNDGTDAINDVDPTASDWWSIRGAAVNVIQLDFAGGAADASINILATKRDYSF